MLMHIWQMTYKNGSNATFEQNTEKMQIFPYTFQLPTIPIFLLSCFSMH